MDGDDDSAGKRERVTLRHVAGRAGVSVTTASFVLSGRRDMRISEATVERVLQAARTLDYRRRLVPAGAPLPAGAPAVGLISDVVATESFGGEMLRGSIAAATDRGHVVLMADSEGVDDLEVSAINALRSRGVERFVYATMGTIMHSVPEALRGEHLVLMNNLDPALPVTSVIPDDTGGGRAAVTALLEAGHSTGIWVVGTVLPHAYAGGRRLAGIKTALRKSGLRLAGHVQCGWWPDETRRAVTALLEAGWWDRERPTAVITMNDRGAMGVYQAVAAAGLRVPQDLSVVSFDNSDLARWLHPALSSVDLPYFDLGRRAIELLFAEERPARTHKLPMTVRPRDSIAAPAVTEAAGGFPTVRRSPDAAVAIYAAEIQGE